MKESIKLAAEVPPELDGERLDQAAAQLFPDYSRSRLQSWIKKGQLRLDGRQCRPRDKVAAGSVLLVAAELEQETSWQPQAIDLDIVYEDDSILVVNKPAGLVVHPAAGNPDGTLQNALLHFDKNLASLPRAGIVHRLDKNTTGLMVIARSQKAHKRLVDAIAARSVRREYRALVVGGMPAGGTIDLPIGRHSTQRTRMAVNPLGKPSVTHFRVLTHFRGHTLLKVMLDNSNIRDAIRVEYHVDGFPEDVTTLEVRATISDSVVDVLAALHTADPDAIGLGVFSVAGALVAIRDLGRTYEFGFPARLHFLQTLGPAGDDPIKLESRGFAALYRTVENCAVLQRAGVMNGNGVRCRRVVARANAGFEEDEIGVGFDIIDTVFVKNVIGDLE